MIAVSFLRFYPVNVSSPGKMAWASHGLARDANRRAGVLDQWLATLEWIDTLNDGGEMLFGVATRLTDQDCVLHLCNEAIALAHVGVPKGNGFWEWLTLPWPLF